MRPWYLPMDKIFIPARASASSDELSAARLGPRFGRLDLCSQLAVLAVEKLGIHFELLPRQRIGICLSARAGSLTTDIEYWKGRDAAGGPSPTLFAYTLPSSALGEIAIRHRITGPNLCFFGDSAGLLEEAGHWIRSGEADGCLCVSCEAVSPAAAEMLRAQPAARSCALFLHNERLQPASSVGAQLLGENDRDIETLCGLVSARQIRP